MRTLRGAVLAVLACSITAFIPPTLASAAPNSVDPYSGTAGTYTSVNPSRILDTRSGNGAPAAKVGPGATLHLQVGGRGGVPATGVSAVTLNVTVTEPTSAGYLTLFPKGEARPTASSLNFVAGWTGANSVTVKVGPDGGVDIYNPAGQLHILADVQGYYSATVDHYPSMNGLYHPMAPQRIVDTRTDGGGKLPADYYLRTGLNFGADNQHIRAYVVNITAAESTGPGYLTAWNGREDSFQETSTLNYQRNEIVPNLAIVPVAPCWGCGENENWPVIGVYTPTTTHVIVDIVGFFDDGTFTRDGLRFDPVSPTRITDTRSGQGAPGALGGASTTAIDPGTVADTAGGPTVSLALNVTAVLPSQSTFLTVWADGKDRPWVSNLNPVPGKATPNAAITGLGDTGKFAVFNAAGSVHLVVDVVGRYYLHEPIQAPGLRATSAPTPVPAGRVALPYRAA